MCQQMYILRWFIKERILLVWSLVLANQSQLSSHVISKYIM